MRKCEKCGASMKLDLRLKVNGGGYGMVVRVDEKQKATTIDCLLYTSPSPRDQA